jgi:hypothetical protein
LLYHPAVLRLSCSEWHSGGGMERDQAQLKAGWKRNGRSGEGEQGSACTASSRRQDTDTGWNGVAV